MGEMALQALSFAGQEPMRSVTSNLPHRTETSHSPQAAATLLNSVVPGPELVQLIKQITH